MHILYCMEFEEEYSSQNGEKRSQDLNRISTEFCKGEQVEFKKGKKKGKGDINRNWHQIKIREGKGGKKHQGNKKTVYEGYSNSVMYVCM